MRLAESGDHTIHRGRPMSDTDQHTDAERREKLWDLIKDTKFAMFTTRHPNGHLHSRPMTTQNKSVDEDDLLWFFMSRKGDPVADLEAEPSVNISYADPGADSYVSVSGTAQVSNDRAKREALWNKATEAWFPKGIDDPDAALVQVRINHASYWDVKSSKLVQLFAMAKAAITGKPPGKLGDVGEVRMN
ncbi:MAG: pyridoxamine 5'-phosphate oxidase family protein [Burkholderiaceae bacterium]